MEKTSGDRIKEARKSMGWTQEQLASAISKATKRKISAAAISMWESGDTKSQRPENLWAAAKALGTSLEYLLFGTEDNGRPQEPQTNFKQVVITNLYTETLPDHGPIYSWHVSRRWIEQNLRNYSSIENLKVITGWGDSMVPLFSNGDPILIDCGISTVTTDGVYFFKIGSDYYIKRIQKIPGPDTLYIAISENDSYKEFSITPQMDMVVIGKVLKIWKGAEI